MSRRPSSSIRSRAASSSAASSSSGINRSYDYAIIGDTTAAVLYASRLIANGVTGTITLITEGGNQATNVSLVEPLDFAVTNARNMNQYVINEAVNLIPSNDGVGPFPGSTPISYNYWYGAGPCGDFISTYIIAQNGPWYPSSKVSSHVERWFQCATTPSCPNNVESIIIDGLSAAVGSNPGAWGIPKTTKVIVPVPSILDGHYKFTFNNGSVELRELGVGVFNELNINLIPSISNIQFTPKSNGLYDITVTDLSGTQTLVDNRPVWQINPFSYLHLATVGTNSQPSIRLPVFYRSVMSIPNITSRVNLNTVPGGLTGSPDLVSSYISFSLYDLDNTTNRSAFVWSGQAYTTIEDLYPLNGNGGFNGVFADSGSSLLIVECVCYGNQRSATYDVINGNGIVQIQANSGASEEKWELKFAEIVADIYYQYTGDTTYIDNPSLLTVSSSVCTNSMCQEFSSLDLYASRESTMVTILETVANLYGAGLYPVPR
jgi:hypothetical protein